jgi:hypothetical protein
LRCSHDKRTSQWLFGPAGPPFSLDASGKNIVKILHKTLREGAEGFLDSADQFTELCPVTGWEQLQHLPAVGSIEDTEAGLRLEPDTIGMLAIPKIYSVLIRTLFPRWKYNYTTTVSRTLYIQYAPNSTFATIQQVSVALSLGGEPLSLLRLNLQPEVMIVKIEMPQPYASVYFQLNTIMNENDTCPIQFPTSYVAGHDNETSYSRLTSLVSLIILLSV